MNHRLMLAAVLAALVAVAAAFAIRQVMHPPAPSVFVTPPAPDDAVRLKAR